MGVLVSILVFVFVLGLVILIHEMGHFIFAKRAGILCHEFSIGMGPIIYGKRIGETLYAIRAIPIGGYVMMSGEEVNDEFVKVGQQVRIQLDPTGVIEKIILDIEDEQYEGFELVTIQTLDLQGVDGGSLHLNEYTVKRDAFYVMKKGELQISPYDRSFNSKTKWQRFLAIFAGPAMNFILAFFVFVLLSMIIGFVVEDSTVIGSVNSDYAASQQFQVGDEIIKIDGIDTTTFEEVSNELDKRPDDRVRVITVIRDGAEVEIAVIPEIVFVTLGFRSYVLQEGDTISSSELYIGTISEGTFAEAAGFMEQDLILSVNDTDVDTWNDLIFEIDKNAVANNGLKTENKIPLVFVVSRDGEEVTLTIGPDTISGQPAPYSKELLESQNIPLVTTRIGIGAETEFNFLKSIGGGFRGVLSSATVIAVTVDQLFNNPEVDASMLAGPVGIYSITQSALRDGFLSLLNWIGLLSVNLGVINLLPIPALDGGRLVFLGYEAVTNKKPNKKFENSLHYVMFLLLMGFIVYVTYNDILRLLNIG